MQEFLRISIISMIKIRKVASHLQNFVQKIEEDLFSYCSSENLIYSVVESSNDDSISRTLEKFLQKRFLNIKNLFSMY